MTSFRLTVKNFRCFPDHSPLRLTVAPGFTAFAGINNAGKSSILRLFWEMGGILRLLAQAPGNFTQAFQRMDAVANIQTLPGEDPFSKLNDRPLEFEIAWSAPDLREGTGKLVDHAITILVPRARAGYSLRYTTSGPDIPSATATISGTILAFQGRPTVDAKPFFDACALLGNGLYLGPFRNTINAGGGERYFDVVVGQQFSAQFHEFKSGGTPSQNEAIYRLQQDITRIFGLTSLEINADPSRTALQVFVDGRSFRLTELGAGLAQFILVLANVLVRQPPIVYIDEPEASLHPALQLDFLTTLASYTTTSSVMLATHNLGLARASSDRIYSCRRVALGVTEVRPLEATPHLAEFLGELGFSAYRDLGYESVLLVEGPSDVKTFQQLLRLWRKDHNVVLLPLGGSSMINASAEAELVEVARIGPKVAAVIDSERESRGATLAPDRQGFIDTCNRLGIAVHVLDRRAIENYLSDTAVKSVLGQQYRALGEYESLRDAPLGWAKRDNWRIARETEQADFSHTDLGRLLDDL
ncbi:MAG TPA: AAA family ATPase [Candidatus Dormibacteraeota bacterium]|nr:AAA family ATPase [Candidatus Dormibacteraeota bacterium]